MYFRLEPNKVHQRLALDTRCLHLSRTAFPPAESPSHSPAVDQVCRDTPGGKGCRCGLGSLHTHTHTHYTNCTQYTNITLQCSDHCEWMWIQPWSYQHTHIHTIFLSLAHTSTVSHSHPSSLTHNLFTRTWRSVDTNSARVIKLWKPRTNRHPDQHTHTLSLFLYIIVCVGKPVH